MTTPDPTPTLTPAQVLERLAYLQELREKQKALRAKGKHDIGLTQTINDIDQEVCEWPAEMLQQAVATLRAQAEALAERERLRGAAKEMVTLLDGPRDAAYHELLPVVVHNLRQALTPTQEAQK